MNKNSIPKCDYAPLAPTTVVFQKVFQKSMIYDSVLERVDEFPESLLSWTAMGYEGIPIMLYTW